MIKSRLFPLILLLTIQGFVSFGQVTKIEIPDFGDKYSDYVKQLESGKTDINYEDFRNSFLDSRQFSKKGRNYDSLKSRLFTEINGNNYNEIIIIAKEMLSIDYTSMYGHYFLQNAYKILGDSANWKKYHDIEFGLLRSITNSGDGETCKTGWHVTQIEEEYFIINMMGDKLQMQSIARGGKNACDKMDVKTEEGGTKTYYFEANKVFEMEDKMFRK